MCAHVYARVPSVCPSGTVDGTDDLHSILDRTTTRGPRLGATLGAVWGCFTLAVVLRVSSMDASMVRTPRNSRLPRVRARVHQLVNKRPSQSRALADHNRSCSGEAYLCHLHKSPLLHVTTITCCICFRFRRRRVLSGQVRPACRSGSEAVARARK